MTAKDFARLLKASPEGLKKAEEVRTLQFRVQ